MHEEYKDIGLKEDKVIEEASEVIQAICKVKRFGLNNYNPFDPTKKTNVDHLMDEIQDLRYALDQYEKELGGLI